MVSSGRRPRSRALASPRLRGAALGLAAWGAPVAAPAQTPPPPASPAAPSPSAIRREFQPPPAARAAPRAAPLAPGPGPAAAAATARGARFTLRELRLNNVTVYPPGALEAEAAEFVGQTLPVAAIAEIAAKLTARYRRDGFVLSQVIVPPQDVTSGVLRLQAVEGFVDRVGVEGELGGPRRVVDAILAPLATEKPLTSRTLERSLLLLGDLPGVTARSVLQPSPTAFGAADLVVAPEQRRFAGFVATDNRNSRLTGPWTTQVGGSLFSPFGLYEQFDAAVAVSPGSNELRYGQVQATLPLAALGAAGAFAGDTLQVAFDRTRTRPDLGRVGLDPLTSRTDGSQFRATWFHPFIRSREENLSGRVSVFAKDATTRDRFDGVPLGERVERSRVIQARLTYDFVDRWEGVNLVDVAANVGLDAFGAEIDPAQPRAKPNFVYVTGTLARLQPLVGNLALYGEVTAQASRNGLPSTDRFDIGGTRFGRGFAPGAITGDSGIATKAELRYGEALGLPWLASYQAYGYYDFGWAVDRTVLRDGRRTERVSTVGAGVRLNVTPWLSINPEIAHQLSGRSPDRIEPKRETRAFVTVVARY